MYYAVASSGRCGVPFQDAVSRVESDRTNHCAVFKDVRAQYQLGQRMS